MRVCIVTIAGYVHGIGGMQDHTSDLASGLARAGHDVEVLVPRHPEGEREVVRDGARWIFLDSPGDQNSPLWLRESYEGFRRRNAKRPFDVVHSESTTGVELVRRGVHREIPFVVTFHGVFLGLAKACLQRAFRTRALRPVLGEAKNFAQLCNFHFRFGNWYRFRACEATVVSHQQLNDTIWSCLLERSRVHVVPNGIDPEVFRPRAQAEARFELGLSPGTTFLSVGRLNREKGMHHAIRALAELGTEFRLVLVGGGREREPLGKLARRLGVEDLVLFTGPQPRETVAKYMNAADVFLFPTERNEAAPLVLPQAMASGLPVVASNVGGISEVVEESGKHGLLIPPGDVRQLTDAMRLLAEDPGLRARLGKSARKRVIAEYTIERMTERTVDVYRLAAERLEMDRPTRSRRSGRALSR
jgi:glycosyltransferase involved in cell wall biosynthesis